MPTSTKMFVEHSQLAMPPSVWLHVNGVSLTTDVHQYQPPVHAYDYRTKHLQSPVQPPTPPLISSPTAVPYSITMIDGPFSHNNNNNHNHNHNTNKQYQKLENTDMAKKFFIDRHIKKAKSLPGLIKGTALSRHTPLQSSTFTSPAPPPHPSTNHIQDDQLPTVTIDNDDDSLPLSSNIEHQNESRRPRVYFADFNKVQFIEDNNEMYQQHQIPINNTYRRHRRRSSKKTSNINVTNHVSPSIQPPQILQNFSGPSTGPSHHHIGQELSIKKQQIFASPRIFSSRTTQLPDILNQSLSIESSLNENSNGKYVLQREKPLIRLPKSVVDIPITSSIDILSETTQNNITDSSSIQDSHIQTHESESGDSSTGMLLHGSSLVSSTLPNRQRPSLRTISLRQQFISPIKLKATGTSVLPNTNHHQQMNNSVLNTRRSASLKQSTSRTYNDSIDTHSNGLSLTNENRPMTGSGTIKQLKRSYVIHFNSKNPLGKNITNDLNETNHHTNKSQFHEPTEERFQNLLTIVRPPYATNNITSSNIPSIIPNDSTISTTNYNHSIGNIRSSRSISARGPIEFQLASNTIIV